LAASLSSANHRHLAHAARNNDLPAVRLMLKAGFPVDAVSQHNATALHWAAWHGNAEMVQLILGHQPQLEDTRNDYESTPLGWAIHGSENGWHRKTGDYAATVEALVSAGPSHPDQSKAVKGHGKASAGTESLKSQKNGRRTARLFIQWLVSGHRLPLPNGIGKGC